MSALDAENHLQPMAIPIENTAATNATSVTATKAVAAMNEEEFGAELRYQSAISVVKSLFRQGLLTAEEYAEIDTKLLEKYAPSLGTLFSENDLITGEFRAIYSSGKE